MVRNEGRIDPTRSKYSANVSHQDPEIAQQSQPLLQNGRDRAGDGLPRLRGVADRLAVALQDELYRKALSIAREREAKLWELRAAVKLAWLWRDQGRRGEARDLLAPVYGWFTEGFVTPDLKDAKALLNELA